MGCICLSATIRTFNSFAECSPTSLTSFSESTGFHPCCHRYLQAGTHLVCLVCSLDTWWFNALAALPLFLTQPLLCQPT
jgi:hypothetical protein